MLPCWCVRGFDRKFGDGSTRRPRLRCRCRRAGGRCLAGCGWIAVQYHWYCMLTVLIQVRACEPACMALPSMHDLGWIRPCGFISIEVSSYWRKLQLFRSHVLTCYQQHADRKACYEDLALCVAHACGGSGMEEIQLKKEKITPRVLLIQDRLGVVDIVRHYERNTKGKTILAPEKQKKKKEI